MLFLNTLYIFTFQSSLLEPLSTSFQTADVNKKSPVLLEYYQKKDSNVVEDAVRKSAVKKPAAESANNDDQ